MNFIKDGVRFSSPEMAMMHASLMVSAVCSQFSVEFVVTGGIEEHQHPSLHVTGGALDYRTRELRDDASKRLFAVVVEERLGDGFDVVLESDHLHVEYDPKT